MIEVEVNLKIVVTLSGSNSISIHTNVVLGINGQLGYLKEKVKMVSKILTKISSWMYVKVDLIKCRQMM
jgi:hypothetical protein